MEKSKQRKQPDALPEHFSSLEEAAEFWDTHDSGDYEEYFNDLNCKADIQRRAYEVTVEADLFKKVGRRSNGQTNAGTVGEALGGLPHRF